jgi:ketosteroid isomerase-like protein
MNCLFRIRFLFVTVAAFSVSAQAEDQQTAKKNTATSGELFDTIARMDSAIFDAFNAHDVDRLMSLFTDDLEFYHDTGGLGDYRQNAESFKKMFASTPDIRRDLVKGSLEVYPIKDYGAMEIGEHRFCHKENGKDDCGSFKFAMVWRKSGESWKISRVLSYGH